MTRIEDLENEVIDLKNALEDAEQRLKEEKENVLLLDKEPRNLTVFYFIDECGDVCKGIWGKAPYSQEKMFKIGNVYKTKEACEFEAERLKVKAELKLFAKKFEYWSENWSFWFNRSSKILLSSDMRVTQDGCLCFESKNKVFEAINFVGEDRVLKYYLGVDIDDSQDK